MQQKPDIPAPTLADDRIHLRPLNPDDYRTLFAWHGDVRNLHLWWADRRILAFDDFVDNLRARLRQRIYTIFLIEPNAIETGVAPMGMVYAYDLDPTDRFAYLCTYLTPDFVGRGIGPAAGRLFGHYLFATLGLRKVYCEVFAYNQPSLIAARHAGFEEEGRLRNHRWFLDRYWDLHILAITRERFYTTEE